RDPARRLRRAGVAEAAGPDRDALGGRGCLDRPEPDDAAPPVEHVERDRAAAVDRIGGARPAAGGGARRPRGGRPPPTPAAGPRRWIVPPSIDCLIRSPASMPGRPR